MSTIDNRRRKANKAFVQSLKNKPCVDCGHVYHPEVMEFDHLRDKSFILSRPKHRSHATILKEIAKCDLVCANCHRMRTFKRRQEQTKLDVSREKTLFDVLWDD